ncbi:MAG: ATP-binding cassette domain-containing protein [Candidatus Paceibacterota bacterium]
MIHFNNVSKIYLGNAVAVKDIDFSIDSAEFISLVGHSGAGKTTLLKLLLAEEAPTSGRVLFERTPVHTLNRHERTRLRRRMGMIFQDFRLLSHKTAYENIAFAMEAAGRGDDEIEADVPYVLDLVDLSDKIWHFPNELSGGEKQRLAIARAIVNQPDVIIADEPTGNLDPVNTYEVIEILQKINSLGTTVILSTHDKGVVDILEGRVVTLENGRIIRDEMDSSYIL